MFSKWISGVTNNLFCLTNIIICIDTWWVKVFLWIISISCNFELGQNKSYSLVRFISQESGNQLLIFLSCYNAWIFHLPTKHIFLQTTNQKHDFEIESVQRKTYSINFRFQFFPAKWDYFYAPALHQKNQFTSLDSYKENQQTEGQWVLDVLTNTMGYGKQYL